MKSISLFILIFILAACKSEVAPLEAGTDVGSGGSGLDASWLQIARDLDREIKHLAISDLGSVRLERVQRNFSKTINQI